MMRFIMPIVLIGIAASVFFMLTNPIYNSISVLKADVASYDTALNNEKLLENERDKLTAKYNAMSKDDLAKLEKLLPENVNNIRLILEIEKIATPYGMVLKDVKYNTAEEAAPVALGAIQSTGTGKPENKDYGTFNLEFSTTGTYSDFVNFTKNLESNLRIVDISSVVFSSVDDTNKNVNAKTTSATEVYKYNFKIKTYWLKN